MSLATRKPAFIAANEKVLEKEAVKMQSDTTTLPPTTTTTTVGGTAPTTTPPPTTTTTTVGGTAPTTTQQQQGNTTTTTTQGTSTTSTTAGGISDEALLSYMRERTGNVNLTMEEMLTSLNRQPELTDDQKNRLTTEKQLQVQAAFVRSGKGTIDDYHRINQLSNIKDADLVRERFFADAREMDGSLKDSEIEEMFQDHYFISDQQGIFTDAEKKMGERRIKTEADAIRERERKPLVEIEELIEHESKAGQDAREWEKKALSYAAAIPKSYVFPIEKIGEKDMEDFIYPFNDDELREIADALKDPAYLLREIRDEKTGKTDLGKLSKLVIANKILHRAVRASASAHYSKGVESVTSVLNNHPDLTNTGGSKEITDQEQQVEEGKQIVKKDAASIMGRGTKIKSV
jgi:hypothetical protein